MIKKKYKKIFSCNFFSIFGHESPESGLVVILRCWIRIRIRNKMNTDPQPWKKGDIVAWQDNVVLTEDEQLSPTFEDMILANVLRLIDTRLPGLVRELYNKQAIGNKRSLMDLKKEILGNVPGLFVENGGEQHTTVLCEKGDHQLER